jgi:transketolase
VIPDREALGMGSHFEAAKGAYLLRDYKAGQPKMGTILVQGTMSTYNTVRILPKLDELGLNVKLVATVSPELFQRQSQEYRESIISPSEQLDLTYITNASRRSMRDWVTHRMADEYAMSPDFDNRWRTGGSPVEVYDEAHLSPDHLLAGITRFVEEREERLSRIDSALEMTRV